MPDTPYKIYSASAGSGKTYTLVKEYLKLILAPGSPWHFRQLLAITFTNKAVNEMKERILGYLNEFSRSVDSPLFGALAEELEMAPEDLRSAARKVLKEILHNYAFFDISTIDKFTHRLIRAFAKDLNIPQNFEVILDTDLLLDEAVGRLLSRAGSDKKLTAVLIDFALEKIMDDKSWDIAYDLNKTGKMLFEETQEGHLEKLEGKHMDDFLELKETLRRRMAALEKAMVRAAEQILGLIEKHDLEYSNFKSSWFPNFILKIYQGDLSLDFSAGWKRNFGMEPLYKNTCPDPVKSILNTLLPEFNKHFQEIKAVYYEYVFLKNAYANLVPLTVLNAIKQELDSLLSERDLLPISAFNRIISNEIKNQPAPFIYERLGEKYRHYFVDEFQDTSELQWSNLIPLFSNALEGEDAQGKQGSLVLVGDAKQAIYRWRGGKAEQFLNLINSHSLPFVIRPSIEDLPVNFRSDEEIIKFNNAFFTEIGRRMENTSYAALFESGNRQRSNNGKGGLVRMEFLEEQGESLKDAYGSKVLQGIQTALENHYEYRDICILTRKRAQGIILSDYLIAAGIPIISSETLLLCSIGRINFLVSLLRYALFPQDPGNRYDILYFLAEKGADRHAYIHKNLRNIRRPLLDGYDFDMEVFLRSPVYDGLEYAIRQFGLAGHSDAYLTFFMDEVLQVEQKEGSGMETFLAYWEKKKDKLSIVAPDSLNAVRIMTIHKSKGLEFPIVIFPFANTPVFDERNPKLWLPVDKGIYNGFEELLINKNKEVKEYGPGPERIYEEEQHKLELDAYNLLYVALTRAIHGLFIITEKDLDKDDSPKQNYSGLFIHYLRSTGLWSSSQLTYFTGVLNTRPYAAKPAAPEERVPFLPSCRNRPGFRILTTAGMLWDTARADAISRGNLIHRLMSLIIIAPDLESALDQMRREGELNPEETGKLREVATRIMSHPKLEPSFREGPVIRNESEIITQNGLILRPDRMVISDDRVTVIDYKTGVKNPLYHQQIEAYAGALRKMGYQIENKIIVYINDQIHPEFI